MRKANDADRDVQIDELEKAISAKYRDHLDALKERRSTVLAARQYVGYAAVAAGGAFLQSFAGFVFVNFDCKTRIYFDFSQ